MIRLLPPVMLPSPARGEGLWMRGPNLPNQTKSQGPFCAASHF
jgi:hypothetical protein